MPSTAMPISRWSSADPARTAARAPMPTPRTTGTSATKREKTGRSNPIGVRAIPFLALQPDLAQRREELRRGGLRAALQPLHVRLDERTARVVVQRDPGGVVEDDLLDLLVALHALGTGRHRVGLVEEAVDGRVAVARGVAGRTDVAAVEGHRQEIPGIGIVGDPALAEEARAPVIDHLDVRGPVQAPQLQRHPDLLQLCLERLRDALIEVARVEVIRERAEPASA